MICTTPPSALFRGAGAEEQSTAEAYGRRWAHDAATKIQRPHRREWQHRRADLDSAHAAKVIIEGGDDYKSNNPVTKTVEIQQLLKSGNPEQATIAEINEALAEIRSGLRHSRRTAVSVTSEETHAMRGALLTLAEDGRMTMSDVAILESVSNRSKGWTMFMRDLTASVATAQRKRKRYPAGDGGLDQDLWSSVRMAGEGEPPL